MELEFEREVLMGYEIVADTTLCQEETLESIVPDACPDILRIVDVCGQAMLSGKQAEDGAAVVNGVVRASILYQPEEGTALRKMEVGLPFQCQVAAPGLTGAGMIIASPRLRAAEARALNPRKVLIRVDLAVEIIAAQPKEAALCTGVKAKADPTICQQTKQTEHYQLLCVQEKPFAFSEEIRLAPGMVGELMAMRAIPICTESKLIGTKLIFKGTIELYLLLQDGNGGLTQCRETLPFSQILEVPVGCENSDCRLKVEVVDVQHSRSGEGIVDVSFELLAQVQVMCRRSFDILQDLYSTSHEVEVEVVPQSFLQLLDQVVRPQVARELIETEQLVRSVADSRVVLGKVEHRQEAGVHCFEAEAWVTVLYVNESDQIQCVRKMIPVACSIPLSEAAQASCWCAVQGDVYASPAAGGVEIRFGIEFSCLITRTSQIPMIKRAAFGQERRAGAQSRPSIVLRLLGGDESLWDIAKAYGTTIEEIRNANELGEDALPEGHMLLIPSIR